MTHSVVLITIFCYLAVLFGVSALASRRADNMIYFTGGRRQSVWAVTVAMISAAMSGVTYVSVPGMVAAGGFGYLQMALGFIAGQFVIAYVLVPIYYRMNVVSVYEYLAQRFGVLSHKSGAWVFFVSKLLLTAIRIMLVCVVLQYLVFDYFGISFWVNILLTVAVIWLYTLRAGVQSVVWTDVVKTVILLASVALCIYYIAVGLGLDFGQIGSTIRDGGYSRVFFFDNSKERGYFFKDFFGGLFSVVAMTGLNQDMMQRTLSCRTARDAQRNVIVSGVLQFGVIAMFLVLGALMWTYVGRCGMTPPTDSDALFPTVAFADGMPLIVGVLFVLGFISSTYSSAGASLTALTTSFTLDILGVGGRDERHLARVRRAVHGIMALAMVGVILLVRLINSDSAIDAVFTLASYSFGPILGLFAFGILTKREVNDRAVPYLTVLTPVLCIVLDHYSAVWFDGFRFGYELLGVNGAIMFAGLALFSRKSSNFVTTK